MDNLFEIDISNLKEGNAQVTEVSLLGEIVQCKFGKNVIMSIASVLVMMYIYCCNREHRVV